MLNVGVNKIFDAKMESFTLNKKVKPTSREEWEKMDKSELIDHIVKLELHNLQLRGLLQKHLSGETESSEKKNVSKRTFDFSKTHKRHVLLKFLYFGWDYQGFARQLDTNNTIEHQLFEVLKRTCLIESPETCNYQRCGRTDKTVSAFCQVISIDIRSKFEEADQMLADSLKNEIDYCGILNRVLPENIQCIAWMPLRHPLYSARFDCLSRTYRYYFPKGNLNIEAMRSACQLLERHADFRNFCKMDVQNGVTNFMRHIQSATIEDICANESNERGYAICYLEIKANAFLLHQIRCIMSILFLIGQCREDVSIINELLNIEKNPCKPQYGLASGVALNLFKCDYKSFSSTPTTSKDDNPKTETDTTSWIYNQNSLQRLIENLQGQWTLSSVRTTMFRNVLDELSKTLETEYNVKELLCQVPVLQEKVNKQQYTKLLNRKRCESLENRIEHFVKKQRLIVTSKET